MDHAFGHGQPFRLGMEEELILVEPGTLALSHASSALFEGFAPPDGHGAVVHDTYEALVESCSPIAPHAGEGTAHLAALRDALRDAGGTFIGAGLHPDGAFNDVVHVPKDRYLEIARTMRGLISRTPTAANHVHVGMPDPETAIAACNAMRAHLPLLQALAAHSPFWHGIDSGFASARANAFRAYPRAEIPRAFAGWDDWVETVDAVVRAGDLRDYTFLWWDIRPHPRLGTLEIRAMDAQSRLADVGALAAFVHALTLACVEDPPDALPPREALSESSFRASRDGLQATLWHDGALRPVAEVAEAALEYARPHARALGGDEALAGVERIVAEGNGADRMRAAYARGGMKVVLGSLLAETRLPA